MNLFNKLYTKTNIWYIRIDKFSYFAEVCQKGLFIKIGTKFYHFPKSPFGNLVIGLGFGKSGDWARIG